MAVGMAMDLGLGFEATVQLAATESEREKVRLTWWSTLLIDRINSWGTGRPIAIADDQASATHHVLQHLADVSHSLILRSLLSHKRARTPPSPRRRALSLVTCAVWYSSVASWATF
jgi:hypothetical protein